MSCTAQHTEFSPELWDCSFDQYHAELGRDSYSSLEVFRDSWQRYRAVYVTGEIPRPDPTPAMLLGSALHGALLEPDHYERRFAIAPCVDRRTKAGKEQYRVFEERAVGKTILRAEQHDLAQHMAQRVRSHPIACGLLHGEAEQAVVWNDPDTSLPLKARWDVFGNGLLVEIKTASDPHPDCILRCCYRLGYHRQAALYLDVARSFQPDSRHRLIVVGSTEPHDVVVYSLTIDALERGRRENRQTLAQTAWCKDLDEWNQYSDILDLELPRWVES